MAAIRIKVARIGNSRGVRLPAASLRRYRIGETVEKLSWRDTAREMARADEHWSAWDATVADDLDARWQPEPRPTRSRRKRR